jgi:hypothetical protein
VPERSPDGSGADGLRRPAKVTSIASTDEARFAAAFQMSPPRFIVPPSLSLDRSARRLASVNDNDDGPPAEPQSPSVPPSLKRRNRAPSGGLGLGGLGLPPAAEPGGFISVGSGRIGVGADEVDDVMLFGSGTSAFGGVGSGALSPSAVEVETSTWRGAMSLF